MEPGENVNGLITGNLSKLQPLEGGEREKKYIKR